MSTNSIGKVVFLIIFCGLALNFVFSPSEAERELVIDKDSFLKEKPIIKKIGYFKVTGYSSSPDETDDTPWLTAINTPTREGIVASNDLPFGTKIKIPSIFGDKIFVVEDRLNQRFKGVIDVWFPSKDEALNFGVYEDVLVEILE